MNHGTESLFLYSINLFASPNCIPVLNALCTQYCVIHRHTHQDNMFDPWVTDFCLLLKLGVIKITYKNSSTNLFLRSFYKFLNVFAFCSLQTKHLVSVTYMYDQNKLFIYSTSLFAMITWRDGYCVLDLHSLETFLKVLCQDISTHCPGDSDFTRLKMDKKSCPFLHIVIYPVIVNNVCSVCQYIVFIICIISFL